MILISCRPTCTLGVYLVHLVLLVLDPLAHGSLKGEDALANLSIERLESGSITGHVRIRSKTQGIALSLGDRITIGTNMFFLLTPR